MAVMVCHVTVITEWLNTEPLLLEENTDLGSCEPLVTRFLSTSQYITWFYEHFCLKTPYFMVTVNALTFHSQPTAQ